jgi:RNA polymerase sigma factor (sigma-70 family)
MKTFNEIYREYKGYIYTTAMSFNKQAYTQDLIQEGNIGLWKAYTRWQETKGEFHYFAIMYIRGHMLTFLSWNSRTIRIPTSQLEKESFEEYKVYSLDEPISENTNLGDIIGDNDEVEEEYDIEKHMSILSQIEKEIVDMRYGLTQKKVPYEDIAAMFNLTYLALQGRLFRAITKMRKNILK